MTTSDFMVRHQNVRFSQGYSIQNVVRISIRIVVYTTAYSVHTDIIHHLFFLLSNIIPASTCRTASIYGVSR
jgi:hypothetical protein